jgi:hypothetical protein
MNRQIIGLKFSDVVVQNTGVPPFGPKRNTLPSFLPLIFQFHISLGQFHW